MINVGQLLMCASILYDTVSGEYIEWITEGSEDCFIFYNAGEPNAILFALEATDEVVPTDSTNVFIINGDTFVRPFFEVDVGAMVRDTVNPENLVTAEYAKQIQTQLQRAIDETFNH